MKSRFIKIMLLLLFVSVAFSQKKLVNVEFIGNEELSEWDLISGLTIPLPKWYNSMFGVYPMLNPQALQNDLSIIRSMYIDRGFLDVDTRARLKPLESDSNKAVAQVLIDEGYQYVIGSIVLNLPDGFDTTEAFKVLGIDVGKVFSQYRADDARRELWNWLANHGYPYAVVEMKWEKTDDELYLVNIEFDVEPGEIAYFGKIRYKGLQKTKKFLLRRELSIKTGDLYSYSAIEESKEELYSTGLFRLISVELGDTAGHPDTVDIIISIVERKFGWYGFSLNFGAKTEYDFTSEIVGEWGHRNVFGNGQSVVLRASGQAQIVTQWQFLSHRYELQICEPWTFSQKFPTTITLYFEPGVKIEQYAWRVQKFGANLTLSKSIGPVTHRGGVTYERADIYGVAEDEAEAIKNEEGIVISRKLNYTYQRDVRDNPLAPINGSLIRLSTDYVGGLLGGDEDYLKLDALWSNYYEMPHLPLIKNLIFANRLRIAAMSNTSKENDIAVINKLATGGANSIRGFEELSVGPKLMTIDTTESGDVDTSYAMLGGKSMLLISTEFRFPIVWRFWGHTFIDLGQVWADWRDVNPNDIRVSTGFGLAFMTPVGPLRVDYGRILTRLDPPPYSRWHISLMYPY